MSIETKELRQPATDQHQEASEASEDPRFIEMLGYIKDELYLEPSEFSKHGKFEPCSSFAKSGLTERFHYDKPVRIVRFFAGLRPIEAGKPIIAAIMIQNDKIATEYVITSKTDDIVPTEISVEVFSRNIPRHSSLGRIALPSQRGNSVSSLYRMQKEASLRRSAARASTKETTEVKKVDDLQPLYDILQKVRSNTEPQ